MENRKGTSPRAVLGKDSLTFLDQESKVIFKAPK